MHGYVQRLKEKELHNALSRSPAVAILGPRQSGKSTTAKMLLKDIPSIYLDLQDRVDRNKLSEPELFLTAIEIRLFALTRFNFSLNFSLSSVQK